MKNMRGFSLLELLIVIAIIAILATLGGGMYRNYAKNVELSSVAQTISADLKHMQSKAMIGEDLRKWGMHFVNGPSANDDYYELFSTPTTYADAGKVVKETTYLSLGVEFSDPLSGTTKDVVFNRISGTTTATTVGVTAEGNTQMVTVTPLGTIY